MLLIDIVKFCGSVWIVIKSQKSSYSLKGLEYSSSTVYILKLDLTNSLLRKCFCLFT